MFTLKNLLLSHHGFINKILLSYSKTDSPTSTEEYEKWYNESNKEFEVNLDLQHNEAQNLNNIKSLRSYLELKVNTWNLFQKDNRVILEVSLE